MRIVGPETAAPRSGGPRILSVHPPCSPSPRRQRGGLDPRPPGRPTGPPHGECGEASSAPRPSAKKAGPRGAHAILPRNQSGRPLIRSRKASRTPASLNLLHQTARGPPWPPRGAEAASVQSRPPPNVPTLDGGGEHCRKEAKGGPATTWRVPGSRRNHGLRNGSPRRDGGRGGWRRPFFTPPRREDRPRKNGLRPQHGLRLFARQSGGPLPRIVSRVGRGGRQWAGILTSPARMAAVRKHRVGTSNRRRRAARRAERSAILVRGGRSAGARARLSSLLETLGPIGPVGSPGSGREALARPPPLFFPRFFFFYCFFFFSLCFFFFFFSSLVFFCFLFPLRRDGRFSSSPTFVMPGGMSRICPRRGKCADAAIAIPVLFTSATMDDVDPAIRGGLRGQRDARQATTRLKTLDRKDPPGHRQGGHPRLRGRGGDPRRPHPSPSTRARWRRADRGRNKRMVSVPLFVALVVELDRGPSLSERRRH